MAKGYEKTAEEDRVFTDVTLEAQGQILKTNIFANAVKYEWLNKIPTVVV